MVRREKLRISFFISMFCFAIQRYVNLQVLCKTKYYKYYQVTDSEWYKFYIVPGISPEVDFCSVIGGQK
jgi:hypothetical protein